MTPWHALAEELDRWAKAGRQASFWWRDDDAAEPTRELDRVLRLSEELCTPLALAVIPAKARDSLATAVASTIGVTVMQHGFAHANHSPDPRKKSELGPERPASQRAQELMAGRSKLAALFGDLPIPVLVPPWNRIDASLVALLPGLGYTGLSTFTARGSREAAPGVLQVNTHIDIIDWLGSRAFIGEAAAIGAAMRHLAARRTGASDPDEPTGLLTHHRAHDAACLAFIGQFVSATAGHGAARWISAREAFRP
jgi:hypothetical protein